MTLLFNRIIKVSIGKVVIEDLRMKFNIERQPDSTPSNGRLTIYNLSDSNEKQLFQKNSEIIIEAGYDKNIGIVFQGVVDEIKKDHRGADKKIQINLLGQPWGHGNGSVPPISSRSYNGEESVRNIVSDLVTQDMGLELGNVNLIPAEATIDNFNVVLNSTAALSRICNRIGISWYEDDGVVRFHFPGVYRTDALRLKISPETGLLRGTAQSTDTDSEAAYRIVTLMYPLVSIDALVDLQSKEVDGGSGTFRVANFRHYGDNWEGEFCTEMILSEIKEPPVVGNEETEEEQVKGKVIIGPIRIIEPPSNQIGAESGGPI